MASPSYTTPVLDEARAAFIQRQVAINVASRNSHNLPYLARAMGCRVSTDRARVTIFLPVSRSEIVLRFIRESGVVAATFARPSTHETLQLKGRDAKVVALQDGDRAVMAAYADSIIADLITVGYSAAFARAILAAISEEAIGVEFSPFAAFVQTPGPIAGQPVQV